MNQKLVDSGALQMVRLALQRDAEEGKKSRGEMLEALDAGTQHVEGASVTAALEEALLNMLGAFDSPIRRLKMPGEFPDEAIESARNALEQAGYHKSVTGWVKAETAPVPD